MLHSAAYCTLDPGYLWNPRTLRSPFAFISDFYLPLHTAYCTLDPGSLWNPRTLRSPFAPPPPQRKRPMKQDCCRKNPVARKHDEICSSTTRLRAEKLFWKIVFAKSPRPCAAEAFRCSKVMWTKFNRKWTMQFWELPQWCCNANSDSKVASRACSELFVMYWRFNSILVHVHALCCPEAESYPLNLMADQFQFYCPYWKTNRKKKQFFSQNLGDMVENLWVG